MADIHPDLAALKARVDAIVRRPADVPGARVATGVAAIDAALSGGLVRAALHEVMASSQADLAAATGFAAGLARLADAQAPILWVRQDFVDGETGWLHGSGLAELGIDPDRLLLVRARDAEGVLKAGLDAVRCPGLAIVVIEPWGMPPKLDLTATRRLALAAEAAGPMVLLLRVAAEPRPGAATTRWRIAAAPSRALAANAPGPPAFAVTLDRLKGGKAGQDWVLEWDRDAGRFEERQDAAGRTAAPLPRLVVPAARHRSAA